MASRTRIANEAWEALFRAQATIARALAAGDVWGAVSPREYGVLYALSNAPSGLRITELGDDVLLTQPGMSRLVARLEGAGLAERVDDPEDGRPAGSASPRQAPGHSGRSAYGTDSTIEDQIAQHAWSSYQHQFAGSATRAERNASDVDFDSPLVRLAAGGKPDPADREAA